MAADLARLDWALIQAFLAVAREGSLSAAAVATGASQPTLGRQVRAAEAALGEALFARHPRGLALTPFGQRILPAASAMAEAAARLALAAAGEARGLTGPVRITASEFVALHWLPEALAPLRAAEPGIALEIVPSDESGNLLFREADIALRMYRPAQLDLVAKHLGEVPLGFFATREYLDRHGRPATLAELKGHRLIGLDRSEELLAGFRAFGLPVGREDFGLRCDAHPVSFAFLCAGHGIGVVQRAVASRDPRLEQVLPEAPLPALPLWLTAHEALRTTPRIRRVWDHLAGALRPWLALDPAGGRH